MEVLEGVLEEEKGSKVKIKPRVEAEFKNSERLQDRVNASQFKFIKYSPGPIASIFFFPVMLFFGLIALVVSVIVFGIFGFKLRRR